VTEAPESVAEAPLEAAADPFAMAEAQAASEAAAAVSADVAGPGSGPSFDGLADEWRLTGRMQAPGSLRDILLRGEPVRIADVRWGATDGTSPLIEAPGLRLVDPDDFFVVFSPEDAAAKEGVPAGPGSGQDADGALPASAPGGWDVVLDLGEVCVSGTVALPAGAGPERLLAEQAEPFLLVNRATVLAGETTIVGRPVDAHVNRARVRAVRWEATASSPGSGSYG
jgi:hypothetical protein